MLGGHGDGLGPVGADHRQPLENIEHTDSVFFPHLYNISLLMVIIGKFLILEEKWIKKNELNAMKAASHVIAQKMYGEKKSESGRIEMCLCRPRAAA